MSPDLPARLTDTAQASVRAGKPLADVVGEVVGLAAAEVPSPVWDAIAGIDHAADVAKATPWLARQFEERPPPESLAGVWFGLYVVRGSSPGRTEAMVALSGGPGFGDPGWLSEQDWQTSGFVPAPGLRALMPLAAAEGEEVRALVAGPVVSAYSLALVASVLDGLDFARTLGGRPQLGVAVGAPGGDTVVLGVLTPGGLDRSDLRPVEPAPAEVPPA